MIKMSNQIRMKYWIIKRISSAVLAVASDQKNKVQGREIKANKTIKIKVAIHNHLKEVLRKVFPRKKFLKKVKVFLMREKNIKNKAKME